MKRRDFLRVSGAAGFSSLTLGIDRPAAQEPGASYDVLVIGAGVFGVWTASHLLRAGKRVAVIDSVGPAHSGASSGGESRVTRCGYGDQELYTEWAHRSMTEWRALSERAALPLFHEIGLLWIHKDGEAFYEAMARVLAKHEISFSRFTAADLRSRFPILKVASDESGFFEPMAGGLMARRAIHQLAIELEAAGVAFLKGEVEPIRASDGDAGRLPAVRVKGWGPLAAERFVVACGPWLDRVCPEAMAGRLFVTRQEVVFFSVEAGRTGALPVWADLPFYGLPSLEGRGFKVADDTHGPPLDMSHVDRRGSQEAIARARALLERRFPSIADSPLSETRVCQYENSSSGDFVLDRHPGLANVWLAGCGSGHGFKHGPAVGAHVAGLVLDKEKPIPRFSLESKEIRQKRTIQ